MPRFELDLNEMARQVRVKRAALQLDQRCLAVELDCSPSALSRLEHAKYTPGTVLAVAICEWLGRPVTDFVRRVG